MREAIRDKERLHHRLEQIDALLALVPTLSFEELDKDRVRYYGIVKMTEIIGEAAYKLSEEFVNSHKEIPNGISFVVCVITLFMNIIKSAKKVFGIL